MTQNKTTRLTDRFIRAAKPSAKVRDIPDAIQTGLVLRIWPSCKKTWSTRYWRNGKSVRTGLGPWPEVSLAEAREKAADARAAKRRGEDPRAALREPEVAEGGAATTFRQAADNWLADQRAHGRRSVQERFRLLELHVFDRIGEKPVGQITRAQIAELLVDLRDRKGLGAQVNRVHAVLSGIFSLALDDGLIDAHPMPRMRRKAAEAERKTRLTLDQLAMLWRAAGEVRSISGEIVRLLILLACRREEAGRMSWSELDLEASQWHLPGERTKGKRDRTIPLPQAALEIIQRQRRWAGGDYVFSARAGAAPFAGWRRAARLLREAAGLPIEWTVHDIRRSVVTIMGDDLGVSEETVARILDHSERARRGVTARYDHSKRLVSVREAMAAWEQLLLSAVNNTSDNVISLPARRLETAQ